MTARLLRRSPYVVCYWKHGEFVFHNFATGEKRGASPIACEILGFFTDWKPVSALLDAMPAVDPAVMAILIDSLVACRLLHADNLPPTDAERAMESFAHWNPEAGFFHTATKNVEFADEDALLRAARVAPDTPMPPIVKRYPSADVVPLRAPALEGDLNDALLRRRSWRRFGPGSVSFEDFSTLLGLCGGIQFWIDVPGQGLVALKTSPSGGARHPVEVYALVWNIEQIAPGLYHYVPDDHVLEVVRPDKGRSDVPEYLPGGDYWTCGCAVLFFTANYTRDLWRYRYSRAYRAPLVEVGHVAQTFCLVATGLGLAPFSAMALNDNAIERDLRVDGISESVLFAAGVGVKPPDVSFAPTPPGSRIPELIVNRRMHPTPAP